MSEFLDELQLAALTSSCCVNSGFCCKQAPCQFGESVSEDDLSCKELEPVPQPEGKYPRYVCGIYDEIKDKPGSESSPAFGAGCCSPIGNEDRKMILIELGSDS